MKVFLEPLVHEGLNSASRGGGRGGARASLVNKPEKYANKTNINTIGCKHVVTFNIGNHTSHFLQPSSLIVSNNGFMLAGIPRAVKIRIKAFLLLVRLCITIIEALWRECGLVFTETAEFTDPRMFNFNFG